MNSVTIGDVLIRCWPDAPYLETVWNAGTPDQERKVPSGPNYRPADLARAEQLGYGTGDAAALAMWRHHDPAHSWLAVQSGEPYSPTLHSAAYGYTPERGIIPAEEQRVFALQAACNGAPVSPAAQAAVEAATGVPLPTLAARFRAWVAQLEERT